MKKAIVIGASGFLGQHLLKVLKDEGIQIYAVHHHSPVAADQEYQIHGGIKALRYKLIDEIAPDYIFHCARPVLPRFKRAGRMVAARMAHRKNAVLIRQLNKATVKPLLVFASGSLIYGNADQPHTESSPPRPISYARQYFYGEKPILAALGKEDHAVCILRLPWLLGSGSWFKWFFLNVMKEKMVVPRYSSGNNRMEILDVSDAARLMLQYAESGMTGICNLPGEKSRSSSEFYSAISKIYNLPIQDYRDVFPAGIEKEAIEAFTSDISLGTNYPQLISRFRFRSLEESLGKIRSESNDLPD